MKPLTICIVDDEPLAREKIRHFVTQDAEIGSVYECANAIEAEPQILRCIPDILFLDIQMPQKDGFTLLAQLHAHPHFTATPPVIIFVTAFDQFALQAFEVSAVDYLLKPYSERRFTEAFQRAKVRVRHRSAALQNEQLSVLLQRVQQPAQYQERIVVKSRSTMNIVKISDIQWIKADGNYVTLHTNGAAYLLRSTLQAMAESLNPAIFVRIHRSAIVNLDYVQSFEPLFQGDYTVRLHSGATLTLSRHYRDVLNQIR